MRIFDQGSGPTIAVVPGVQGRWEWMEPGLEALAAFGRVVSVSLCGEPGSGCALASTPPRYAASPLAGGSPSATRLGGPSAWRR